LDLDAIIRNLSIESLLRTISIYAIPVLFALALHEVAHGWAAKFFGDRTAELLGRLSLNPLKHIDPVGTLLIPGVLVVLSVPMFGWARPVPVALATVSRPRTAAVAVAAAGPLANALMALVWVGLLALSRLPQVRGVLFDNWLMAMAQAGIFCNIILTFLHLIPLPPLDAGRLVASLLPERFGTPFAKLEPFGLLMVLALGLTFGFNGPFRPALQVGRELLKLGGMVHK
jgi:Zn-dependent protease